jgi:hypothetical protein
MAKTASSMCNVAMTFSAMAVLGLSACSSERSGEFTTEEGDTGSYSVDPDSGETNMTITTDEGTTTLRSGSDVPIDLPLGFSVYPGAEVTSNAVVDHNGGEGSMVIFDTSDSPDDVVSFYREQAEAAGIEIKVDLTINDGRMLGGEGSDGEVFTINVSANEQGANGQLMVGDKLGG